VAWLFENRLVRKAALRLAGLRLLRHGAQPRALAAPVQGSVAAMFAA
jgi:hypothetical protein